MVVGFNHNFSYQGAVYHIQTEDSGLKSPHIVTLLYHGGTILASRKTSYADIAKVDNLEQVVEELMKEQHKGMLRSLKNGEFDEVIARYRKGASPAPGGGVKVPEDVPATPPGAARPAAGTSAPVPAAPSASPSAASAPPVADKAPPATPQAQPAPRPPAAEASLDEIILSYLIGKDK